MLLNYFEQLVIQRSAVSIDESMFFYLFGDMNTFLPGEVGFEIMAPPGNYLNTLLFGL